MPAIDAAPPSPSVQELVVTATRLPTPLADAPDVHVVTARDIALRQTTFAFDVLATVPGLQISRDGAYGGVTTLSIRGASSDKTLVLVDGAPVNDPTSPAGGFDFSSLDLAGVDRIEVLSGPQGSLWGSDAIGGVVSITTREPDGLRAGGEAGSFGAERAYGSAGVAGGRSALGVGASWFSTGGISKADVRDGNPERDGFRSFTAQANGRIKAADWLSLDARVRYNRAHAALDSFGGPTGVIDGPDSQDSRTAAGFIRAKIVGPLGLRQELRADGMDMDRVSDSYFGGFLSPFEAKGRRIDLRWTAQRAGPGPNAFVFGVERQGDHEDTGDGGRSAHNLAGFAIWRFTPSQRVSTTLSVRRDRPSGYDGVTTARAAGVVGLVGGLSAHGSVGQGFKAPSIFQTTYPCPECLPPGAAVGLKPERALGWDAGLTWTSPDGRLHAQATAYGLTVRDQIDYEYPRGYINLERTRTTGAEVEGSADIGHGLSVKASYAYADAKDLSTGLPLLRIPRHVASGEIAWRGRRAEAALTVRGQSRAADVYGEIRPFVVADLAGAYRVSRRVSLTARIENLADARYQEAYGYGEPGFGLFVGFRLEE